MNTKKISLGKIFALLFLALGSQVMAAWDGKTVKEPSIEKIGGKDYYIIRNEENLAWFAAYTNDVENGKTNVNARVEAKFLDMGHRPFTPIAAGKGIRKFYGIFDGNHVTIKNLYVNSELLVEANPEYGQNIGLIAALAGTVRNVVLEDVDIRAASDIGSIIAGNINKISVGTVVGWMSTGTIEGCYVSGIIYNSGKGQAVGGIVGNADEGTVKDNLSVVSIQISGSEAYVGGIIGQAKTKLKIKSCVYDGGKFINERAARDGGVIGLRYEGTTVDKVYYDSGDVDKGVAEGDTAGVYSVGQLNDPEIVCFLNDGEWSRYGSSCSVKEGVWSTGDYITNQGVSKNDKNETVFAIRFDANGGYFPDTAKTVKYLRFGELLTASEITEPVNADGIFLGWSMDPGATTPASSEVLDTAYGQRTVYAVWKPLNLVEVKFNANHGESPEVKSKMVNAGDSVVAVSAPGAYEIGGVVYYFKGWNTDKNAVEPLAQLGVAKEGLIYYAVWTTDAVFTVLFDVQGKNVEIPSQQVVPSGKVVKIEPKADGYIFDGWFTDKACLNAFDFDTPIAKSMTLFAKWTPVRYKIAYHMNGGENSDANPADYTIDSKTIVIEKPNERVGYLFDGWYYDADCTQPATQISKGSSRDVDLYAKWTAARYEIIYSAGARGLGTVEIGYKKYGDSLKLASETYSYYNVNYRVSFLHKGWALADGGAKAYDFGGVYREDADAVLYPYWSKHVKVHYGPNDGDTIWVDLSSVESDSQVSASISEILLSQEPAIELPTKDSESKYLYALMWVSDSLAVYEPIFSKFNRKNEIVVAYGPGTKDTIRIKDNGFKTDEELQTLIKEAFASRDPVIPLPSKDSDSLYEYELAKFVLNSSGIYEPAFKRLGRDFKINFHLPEGAELVEEFTGYHYGRVTVLPKAKMVSDESWIFKGWYTKSKGRGNRVKAMRETDYGNKSLYPLFQKTVRYDAGNERGEIEVLYTDRAEITIDLALQGVAPKDFYKGGARYTFAGWVLEDGVYTATFKRVDARFSVALDARTLEIQEAQMGARYVVFGMDGRIVKRGVVSNGSQRVDVPKSGSYTVRVDKAAVQVNVK